jgi:uncharacterized protein (TIGR02757 family)
MKSRLDALYRRLNKRRYVHPDPLELVYGYRSAADQEIVGLVAACLAYGRVAQILSSVSRVLEVFRGSPRAFLERATESELRRSFLDFRHRFTSGAEIAALLVGVKRAIEEHGSMETLFVSGLGAREETILPGLARFVERLRVLAGGAQACSSLLSSPADGSACKRLNLYLRWMVRRDEVDPGPWRSVSAARLVVPLDTHMFRAAARLGLTSRRQADLRTAVEITGGFARIRPRDPVRYDFCITRLGINPECRDFDALAEPKGQT